MIFNKHLYFLITSLAIAISGYAQTTVYHPIPDSNVIWSEFNHWDNPPCNVQDSYTLFLLGDTTIGIYDYKKIFASGNIGALPCYPPPYDYYNEYRGAVRQDTSVKKVYFIKAGEANERILYDFNLNIGDTIVSDINGKNVILEIDSVLVGLIYHKRFLLSAVGWGNGIDTNYAIIEGVGSTLGLYNSIIPPTIDNGSSLGSFCVNNMMAYPSTNANCNFYIGINKTGTSRNNINIFPNPFSTAAWLQAAEEFHDSYLIIYNSLGNKVKEYFNISGYSIRIDRGDLSGGVYFINLIKKGKIYYWEKMLIIE